MLEHGSSLEALLFFFSNSQQFPALQTLKAWKKLSLHHPGDDHPGSNIGAKPVDEYFRKFFYSSWFPTIPQEQRRLLIDTAYSNTVCRSAGRHLTQHNLPSLPCVQLVIPNDYSI